MKQLWFNSGEKIILNPSGSAIYADTCCCCCPDPPPTVTANFEGGAEDGWNQTLSLVAPSNWAADFEVPPDPKCGPYVGLRTVLSCANGVWAATIHGWVDISDNPGTLVSLSCDPFQVVMSFQGFGDDTCSECKESFRVRFVAGR